MFLIYRIGKKRVKLESLEDYLIGFIGVTLNEMPKAENIDFYFNIDEDFEEGLDNLFDLVEKRGDKNKDVFFEVVTTKNRFEFYGRPIMWGTAKDFCNIRVAING